MTKKDIKFPHIKLEGKSAIFEKGYGRGGSKINEGGINQSSFKNKLSEVLSIQDIRAKFQGKIFFEMKLRLPYYNPIPQKLFKQLGVEVRSVFHEKLVIVSGNPETIEVYKQRTIINKDYLRCIEDIKVLESINKIGDSIKKIWNEKDIFNVEIGLIENPSEDEITELRKNVKSFVNKIKFGKYTSSAIASLSKKQIETISEMPIIKRVAEISKWQATFLSKASSINSNFKIIEIKDHKVLPNVCVIDTGIAKNLKNLCLETTTICEDDFDKDDHGTGISSMCMFNKKDLTSSNTLTPSVNIISHKISESCRNNKINLFEEIINAIELHKNKTRIFCFSWNCVSYDESNYEDRIKELDQYLHENNVLLINSAGNIDRDTARSIFHKYPQYLSKHPVMTPSEAKYVLSVGSTFLKSEYNVILSSFGRLFLPLNTINKPEDLSIRIKPELFAEGGFINYGKTENDDIDRCVVCLNSKCERMGVIGTSIATPQVARIAALLQKIYNYKNAETLKSMTYLKAKEFKQSWKKSASEIEAYQGKTLVDHSDILDADDGFYFFFEDSTRPHERIEDKKKDKVYAMSWKIPVVEEIEYVEFVISHSNSNPFEDIRKFSTRIVTSIHKPGRKGPLSKLFDGGYGTIGKKAPLIHGKYKYAKNTPEGMWTIKAYVETTGIPKEYMDKINIRYGVAVKIKIKDEFQSDKERIYNKILQLLGEKIKEREIIETIITAPIDSEKTGISQT